VDDAFTELSTRSIELDGAARSALAANQLVVLCSDHRAQPVLDIASSP